MLAHRPALDLDALAGIECRRERLAVTAADAATHRGALGIREQVVAQQASANERSRNPPGGVRRYGWSLQLRRCKRGRNAGVAVQAHAPGMIEFDLPFADGARVVGEV